MTGLDSRRIGLVVRALRVRAGWDQAELGRRCGYSASQVSRWETGRSPLRNTEILVMLARALEVPTTVLGLSDIDPPPMQWLSYTPLTDAVVARPPAAQRRAPDPPRRRWNLPARDLQHRPTYLVTEVHAASGTVTVQLHGPAVLHAVLHADDVRRLQQHLADALACALADGAER